MSYIQVADYYRFIQKNRSFHLYLHLIRCSTLEYVLDQTHSFLPDKPNIAPETTRNELHFTKEQKSILKSWSLLLNLLS